MTDTQEQENRKRPRRTILRYSAVSACLFVIISLYAFKLYISSPRAAARLSHLVASSLHHPFTVGSLGISSQGITLSRVSIGNPSGFPQGNMLSIRTVILSPNWMDIIHGRRSFTLISLDRPRIELQRNTSGSWNFDPFRKRFATGKTGPGLSVAKLVIRNGALSVNGRGISDISLQLLNLETRGTADARLVLGFEDGAHDRFSLEGTVRPGKEPSYRLRLTAPRITFAAIPELIGKKPPFPLSGTGEMLLNSAMNNGNITADMRFRFHNVPMETAGRQIPLFGKADIQGTYDRKLDQAEIAKADISVNDLIRVHASGTVNRVGSKREFAILAGIDKVDIARIAALLPEETHKALTVAGTMQSSGIRISGAGRKITSASGSISLRDGSLSSGNEAILRKVSGELTVSPSETGLLAAIRLSQKETEEAMLQRLAADGTLFLDRHLKPVSVRISSLEGNIDGVAFSGNGSFIPTAATPVSAALSIPETDLSRLNRLPALRNAPIEGGRGSLSLELAGSGIRQATGTAKAHISRLSAKSGGNRFGIDDGTIASGFALNNRRVSASGTASFRDASYGSKTADGAFSYALADRTITIEHARLKANDATLAVERVSAQIPRKQLTADTVRYPLSMELSGCSMEKEKLLLSGLSGKLRADYLRTGREQWLEGSGRLESSGIFLKGNRVAAPAVDLAFVRRGAHATLGGSLLNGKLSGTVAFDPFALSTGATADITLTGAALREAVPFIPDTAPVKPGSGTFDAAVKGSYASGAPLHATVAVDGRDISLLAKGGKQILNGVTATVSGSADGKDLTLDHGVIGTGKGIALKIGGNMNNFLSPEREGRFTSHLGKTDINLLLDRFANTLPAILQEATATGSIAADAELALKAGKPRMNAEIALEGITLGVESQKLAIGRIDGIIPISFAPSAGRARIPEHRPDFIRDNFPSLLERLEKPVIEQHSLVIAGISFGPLQLGETRLMLRSREGLTEISSLRSSLYDGALLGTAYLSLADGHAYGADLLMNDLSLARFCNSFPKIRGYISGRVDGLLSLAGGSQGKEGLIGLTELWTREAKREKMVVSREFLQKLAGRKLSGFFFSDDRPYDRGEISASLEKGFLEFYDFAMTHTNLFGIRDLSVTIAESHNRIALEHLFNSIKNAATRGKSATTEPLAPAEKPAEQPGPGFNWEE